MNIKRSLPSALPRSNGSLRPWSRTAKNTALAAFAAGLLFPLPAQVQAQEQPSVEELKTQLQQLQQKLNVLERRFELDQEATSEKAKTAPVLSAGVNGVSFRSADTNFTLKLRGYVQTDARFYLDDGNHSGLDTFLIRRARPIIEGTVYEKYDYRIMLDLGSNVSLSSANNPLLQDAYLNARFLPEFQVQVGKFKEPVSLERLQSGSNLLFGERGYPSQLAPNRDVGIQVQGDLLSSRLNYAVGAFNGTADGGSSDFETSDEDKDVAARLFATPFQGSGITPLEGLGLGVSGTIGQQEGALRTYTTPGQQRFFAYRTGTAATAPNVVAGGEHWRLVPQGYYYWGPFGLYGEYAFSNQEVRQAGGGATSASRASLLNRGWQIAASYILTGEDNAWKGILPRRPFSLSAGGLGAWEVAARVGQLTIDEAAFPIFADANTSAREATSWGVGVNWYLNKNVKVTLDYENTRFEGGQAGAVTSQEEHFLLSRVQFSF